MATSGPTDAEWATVPRSFWLAMRDLHRERDDMDAERGAAARVHEHLQQDYTTSCVLT